jgi:hypothetical protein
MASSIHILKLIWIFLTKMAQDKALILFKLNSHVKMDPDSLAQRLDARGTRLVTEQSIDPFLDKAFLPAPNTGL